MLIKDIIVDGYVTTIDTESGSVDVSVYEGNEVWVDNGRDSSYVVVSPLDTFDGAVRLALEELAR